MVASKKVGPKVEVVKSPDFKRIYVSGVIYGGHTPADFRIGLYRESTELSEGIISAPPKVTIKREIIAELTLAPLTAKLLAERLSQDVASYEKKFGKIPSPPKGKMPPPPRDIYA